MQQQQPHLTEFTEAQRAEALRHFQIIRPFLEDGVPLTHIATEQQLQLRTLRRWVQHYRARGLLGLLHKSRKTRARNER